MSLTATFPKFTVNGGENQIDGNFNFVFANIRINLV